MDNTDSRNSGFSKIFIRDDETLKELVEAYKKLGKKIVLLSGTFDLIHIGHGRYLEKARSFGDVLIVGTDEDEKVRARKGPNRPINNELERLEMLYHIRHVDFVYLKRNYQPKWHLIRLVKPHVLVLSKSTKTRGVQEIESLRQLCMENGEVIELEPQATTTTSAKIRLLIINSTKPIEQKLVEILEFVRSLTGRSDQ